ncbi:hypothetical protein [Neobacillus kokaensis]|uniref:Uncharacterized protein n=1 Tax=Neobacillus kokaensis TaxID=2759023 RepID=A0ABQ3N8P1_9BACI|nr:hypothetical protein [Neobacillus kokaensis]GHH99948.1 hypothetical protein AM1BK_34910 [Neobacillus kokaensis]
MTKTELIKKLDNIWYHYKSHILIGIFVLAALIPLVFFDKDKKPSALNVTIIGNAINPKEQNALQKKASGEILNKDSTSEIKFNFWQVSDKLTSPTNMDLYQKLLAQVAAKDIDIIILDRSDYLVLSQQEAFKELDFIKKDNQNVQTDYDGISLTGNELLLHAGYNPDNKMMAIITNTEREKTAKKFVQWIVDQAN